MQLFTRCRVDIGFEFVFLSYLNFTLITVGNIYHSQNLSSNRNGTVTVIFTQRGNDRISLRFQALQISVMVSHFFSCRYRVNATPNRKNFVPFSNSAVHRVNYNLIIMHIFQRCKFNMDNSHYRLIFDLAKKINSRKEPFKSSKIPKFG